jgi:hypothetical protein
MPTEKEVLNELLSATLKLDEAGVTSLYNEDGTELKDDALSTILSKYSDHIASLKPDLEKIKTDQYKKGQSESLSKYEKEIATKYGLRTDKRGIEFIDELVAQFKNDHADDPDKIRKHQIFLDEVERLNKEREDLESRFKNDLDTYKKTVEKEKMFSSVSDHALAIFEGLKPILSEDPTRALNQKRIFLGELAGYDYAIRDGRVILLDKEGGDALDNLGNRLKFEDFVKDTASKYFDFKVSEDKSAPNHKQTNNSKSTSFIINSEADFITLMKDATAETRPQILDAYNEAKAKGKF